MLKGAFFFGSSSSNVSTVYPDQTTIASEGGIMKITWGKNIPANFTVSYNSYVQNPGYHKNRLDFSKVESIGSNNFNDSWSFGTLCPDGKLNLNSLQTLGNNCFNDLGGNLKELNIPKTQTISGCFNSNTLTKIVAPELTQISNRCFSDITTIFPNGVRAPLSGGVTFEKLETISGSASFCNVDRISSYRMNSLKYIGAGNFLNSNPNWVSISHYYDNASRQNLANSIGESKIKYGY